VDGQILELVESRIDQSALERRHDDQVRGAERSGNDSDEDERNADPDAARQPHPLLRSEAIARAADRKDQLGIARVPLDLLAKVANVDIDRPRLTVVGPPTKSFQELSPRKDDAWARRQHHEHLELDERELDGLPTDLHGSARQVDPELARSSSRSAQHAARARARRARTAPELAIENGLVM
jgi:hypothetical protein